MKWWRCFSATTFEWGEVKGLHMRHSSRTVRKCTTCHALSVVDATRWSTCKLFSSSMWHTKWHIPSIGSEEKIQLIGHPAPLTRRLLISSSGGMSKASCMRHQLPNKKHFLLGYLQHFISFLRSMTYLVECARISHDNVMPVLTVMVANLNNFCKKKSVE